MKILIYKRTHRGDPDERGIFGVEDCMGHIRNYDYKAVIGVGAKYPLKGNEDLKFKINWVGLCPKQEQSINRRGHFIIFRYFKLYEEEGKDMEIFYPNLLVYMRNKRWDMSACQYEPVRKEIADIIEAVKKEGPFKYGIINFDELDANPLKANENCSCSEED